jgi:hypothetical protein
MCHWPITIPTPASEQQSQATMKIILDLDRRAFDSNLRLPIHQLITGYHFGTFDCGQLAKYHRCYQ